MRKTKRQQVEQKLSVVRRSSYTLFAFALFELSGVFALAGLKGLYVVIEVKSNAFYPKKYVDVSIREPNEQEYTIKDGQAVKMDENGNVVGGKVAYVENAGSSKKAVILRAKIVAEIYDETNSVYQESMTTPEDYTVSTKVGDTDTYQSTYSDKDADHWYYDDGYYYYTSIVDVNTDTTSLFDKVEITPAGNSKIPEDGYVKFHVIIDSLDAKLCENKAYENYWQDVPSGLTTSLCICGISRGL